jgi:hypothetical protein
MIKTPLYYNKEREKNQTGELKLSYAFASSNPLSCGVMADIL